MHNVLVDSAAIIVADDFHLGRMAGVLFIMAGMLLLAIAGGIYVTQKIALHSYYRRQRILARHLPYALTPRRKHI